MSAGKLEELVLADLLRHPGQAEETIRWLPVEVFTSENRRVIYGDIRRRVQDGEPVDPLIIAWDLNGSGEGHLAGGLVAGEVLRIAAVDAAPGTAGLLGDLGFTPVVVDIGEFEKLEGCVTCLSVLLPGR